MVCSPHFLATRAGTAVLRRGGNAVDACVAVNAVLQVVYPPMCHLGGDGFWMVWRSRDRTLVGLNGSGRAPAATSAARLRALGHGSMPQSGPHSVTVPGCVDGWVRLLERCGTLPLADVLGPATRLADEGFQLTAKAAGWLAGYPALKPADEHWLRNYWPGGVAPVAGQVLRQPELAATYRLLGAGGRAAFYEGEIAARIAARVQELGGWLTEDDLAAHQGDWVEPVRSTYRGVTLAEMPPNSQGTTAQLILNLVQGSGSPPEDPADRADLLLRAFAVAYRERDLVLTDPGYMAAPPDILAHPATAARLMPELGTRGRLSVAGDTAYFCAVDRDGNCCSAIQSLYYGFGSGIVVPGTGIVLQARGAFFSLAQGHRNELRGGARTLHTLMPAMAFRGGVPWLVFGTMGGNGQAQIHAQFMARMIDEGSSIGDAIAAPRMLLGAVSEGDRGDAVSLEPGLESLLVPLASRGWNAAMLEHRDAFGHAHMIRIEDGQLEGAADPRADSLAEAV
ncbi:MAG: gamma-glutamyltransferase family protein [Candidatus Dormibacteria bacterium]